MRLGIPKWLKADVIIERGVGQCRCGGVGVPLGDEYVVEQLKVAHGRADQVDCIEVCSGNIGIRCIVEHPYPIGASPATHVQLHL